MNLNEHPESVTWPATHYAFVEKIGPFKDTAQQAWQEVRSFSREIATNNKITGAMSLYKMGPKIYRAGYILAAPPVQLPEGILYELFAGGKYIRFVLNGSYSNLPEASGRVWGIAAETKIQLRDDYAIENYLNDPDSTPEDQLVTEILIPTA
jgi:effector-binding domain-containing protein